MTDEDSVVIVLGDPAKYLQRLASDPVEELRVTGRTIVFVGEGDHLRGKSGYVVQDGVSGMTVTGRAARILDEIVDLDYEHEARKKAEPFCCPMSST